MTETKAESQNYLVNPYSSLGPLPFDEYVLSVLRFRHLFSSLSISFRLHACHLSNGHERGVIRRTEVISPPLSCRGWIVLPIRFNSPFPHALHYIDRR